MKILAISIIFLFTAITIVADETKSLIKELGDDSFRVRVAAEKKLMRSNREALPFLRQVEHSDDPEVRQRARRIMIHILNNPNNIPQKVYILKAPKNLNYRDRQAHWKSAMDAYNLSIKIATSHTEGKSSTSGNFFQSFLPKSKRIEAVAVHVYPVSSGWGWLRLDIYEDNNGRPAKAVLVRCWVRVNKNTRAPHNTYMVFDIPDLDVKPDQTYWLGYSEYRDAASNNRSITNYGISTNKDYYKDGVLIRNKRTNNPSILQDVHFKIIKKTGKVKAPLMQTATEAERKTLPKE
ncbi:HEAT repeat domain-containing protein [bacterium AH-315-E10]|nr:HEAT repeat domain-containing protein [bacterium AH-315-E10]